MERYLNGMYYLDKRSKSVLSKIILNDEVVKKIGKNHIYNEIIVNEQEFYSLTVNKENITSDEGSMVENIFSYENNEIKFAIMYFHNWRNIEITEEDYYDSSNYLNDEFIPNIVNKNYNEKKFVAYIMHNKKELYE